MFRPHTRPIMLDHLFHFSSGLSQQAVSLTQASSSSRQMQFLEEVIEVIRTHLHEKSFSVLALARTVKLSRSQLDRRLLKLTGRRAGRLMREIRLIYAANCIMYDIASIGDISHNICFSDSAHFARSFKQFFGLTPSDFKKASLQEKEALIRLHAEYWQINA